MYRRPSGKKEALRLTVTYTIMTLSVLVLVALLVLTILNYRFNTSTGTLEQRGLIQFDSIPSGATVAINGSAISPRTPTKFSIDPGNHQFSISKDGYHEWQKEQAIGAGTLVWLNYARLVPTNLETEVVQALPSVHNALAAPSLETIVIQSAANSPTFQRVNIARDTPEIKEVALPTAVFTSSDAEAARLPTRFDMMKWDDGGRYLLLNATTGDATEWVVFDTESPEKSRNLTRELALPIQSAEFSGKSGNVLYIATNDAVRKIDLSAGTISRALVEGVESFRLYDSNTVTYTTKPNAEGLRSVGIYREGETQAHVIRTAKAVNAPMSIALGSYYSSTYIAVAEGAKMTLYRGQYDKADGLAKVTEKAIDSPVDRLEFNPNRSHILIRAGSTFASYDIEHGGFAKTTLPQGSARDLRWLDDMNLAYTENGMVVMEELDGMNAHEIMTTTHRSSVTLSRNGTYMYSVSASSEGQPQLQRVRMILK